MRYLIIYLTLIPMGVLLFGFCLPANHLSYSQLDAELAISEPAKQISQLLMKEALLSPDVPAWELNVRVRHYLPSYWDFDGVPVADIGAVEHLGAGRIRITLIPPPAIEFIDDGTVRKPSGRTLSIAPFTCYFSRNSIYETNPKLRTACTTDVDALQISMNFYMMEAAGALLNKKDLDLYSSSGVENFQLLISPSEKLLKAAYELSSLPEKKINSFGERVGRAFYFTVVTITTLGYGDVVPVSNLARIATGGLAILGIVFIGLFLNSVAKKAAGR